MELLNIATCNNRSHACVKNTCDKCKNNSLFNQFVKAIPQDVLQEPLKWYQWNKDNGSKESVRFLNEELESQLEKFILHCYEKSTKSDYFKKLRQNPTKCVLQVDFSENFTFLTQNEIQSAHWTHKRALCTLLYLGSLNVIARGKKKLEVTSLPVIICSMTIDWHFFATSHGKRAVDGVGGTVKGVVYRGIMSEKFTPSPNDAKSIAECANFICNGVEVIYCLKEDIER
ncbi:hypothetical protein AVEN_191141-1 [Araneus ventricosus]|uniref:Uncharacterized protein n=1 Tax=Araneus ventricosus TaxID=182803 RepID=A0A4Y2AXU8_ARAVE|nr:hypothetical protein AVEN_191141-1 [Araneus ventricosus]